MQTLFFDLQGVHDEKDFYRQLEQQVPLHDFGQNLDALWDILTGDLTLPLRVVIKVERHTMNPAIKSVIDLMREAEVETEGLFTLTLLEAT